MVVAKCLENILQLKGHRFESQLKPFCVPGLLEAFSHREFSHTFPKTTLKERVQVDDVHVTVWK